MVSHACSQPPNWFMSQVAWPTPTTGKLLALTPGIAGARYPDRAPDTALTLPGYMVHIATDGSQ